jgi:hypothetical protein
MLFDLTLIPCGKLLSATGIVELNTSRDILLLLLVVVGLVLVKCELRASGCDQRHVYQYQCYGGVRTGRGHNRGEG